MCSGNWAAIKAANTNRTFFRSESKSDEVHLTYRDISLETQIVIRNAVSQSRKFFYSRPGYDQAKDES